MTPDQDPVRQAVARYLERFPAEHQTLLTDPTAHAYFRMLERALVQADMAMQDEGLRFEARRRVVAAALYGSAERAARDRADREVQLEQVSHQPARVVLPVPGGHR